MSCDCFVQFCAKAFIFRSIAMNYSFYLFSRMFYHLSISEHFIFCLHPMSEDLGKHYWYITELAIWAISSSLHTTATTIKLSEQIFVMYWRHYPTLVYSFVKSKISGISCQIRFVQFWIRIYMTLVLSIPGRGYCSFKLIFS